MAKQPAEQATADTTAGEQPTPSRPGAISRIVAWLRTSKLRMAAAAIVAVGVAGLMWGLLGTGHTVENLSPAEQFRTAIALLDQWHEPHAAEQARQLAGQLKQANYRDPSFPGAPEYVLGIVEFRETEEREEAHRLPGYRAAAKFLNEAGLHLIDREHRPQWSFALGKSLYATGDPHAAEPRLVEALETHPPGFVEISMLLQDIYVQRRSTESLTRALEINAAVLARNGVATADLDQAYLRRSEILLALNRPAEADEVLARISEKVAARQGTLVIHARADMASGKFPEARQKLEPVAREVGLDDFFPRQASYLLGLCYELEQDLDNASATYGETVRRYPESQEALAALLRRANLLRKNKRNEEALEAYDRVLEQVRPETFSNRWITLDEFRGAILSAWRGWTDSGELEAAIELSKHMTPMFSEIDSRQAKAAAFQSWAEQLDRELAGTSSAVRKQRAGERLERWRMAGKAYAELAQALFATSQYAGALSISADHYRKGHDFESALTQITKFINTRPEQHMALAYVRRGAILMDLERLDEALEHFQTVLDEYPTDIAVFESRYLVGACHIERNEPQLAEQAWRSMVTSKDLDPSADEWQRALFALGRLLYTTAAAQHARTDSEPRPAEGSTPPAEKNSRLDEAVRRLREFVTRYPNRPEAAEARFLLALALQNSAELPRAKYLKAETENARKELLATMQAILSQAQSEFTKLQEQLLAGNQTEMLDDLGQRMLRDCYFERAHTLSLLGDYEQAIAAYNSAANRYPDDPQVLLAYLQMAQCYDRMGKRIDARGAAIQALLIHKNIPEAAFRSGNSNLSHDEWKAWLNWAQELYQLRAAESPATATTGPT